MCRFKGNYPTLVLLQALPKWFPPNFVFVFCHCLWYWAWNSGPYVCQASLQPLSHRAVHVAQVGLKLSDSPSSASECGDYGQVQPYLAQLTSEQSWGLRVTCVGQRTTFWSPFSSPMDGTQSPSPGLAGAIFLAPQLHSLQLGLDLSTHKGRLSTLATGLYASCSPHLT